MMKESENWRSAFKNEFKSYEVLIDQFLNEKVITSKNELCYFVGRCKGIS